MAKKYLDLEGLTLFYDNLKGLFNEINSAISSINSYLNFLKSSTSGNTLSNINVNSKLHIVNVDSDQELKLIGGTGEEGSVAPAGRDIHIIARNISPSTITITLPQSYDDILVCESSYNLETGKYLEINIISDGDHAYYRVAEQG